METSPLELKINTKNSSDIIKVCVKFVPDNYDEDKLANTLCVKLGTQPQIHINDCESGTGTELPFQHNQLEDGVIICNITKTVDSIRFDIREFKNSEIKLVGSCNIDVVWVIFTIDGIKSEMKNDVLFHKSTILGGKNLAKTK